MADVVDSATRSRMMASIRSTDTRPELAVRSALHRRGYRFRVHVSSLPGRPDIVLPKWRAVVFVHGCFWHGHDGCRFFRLPQTRAVFWERKIAANRERDVRQVASLKLAGWRVVTIWECAVRRDTAATCVAVEQFLLTPRADELIVGETDLVVDQMGS
ncbi:very short patch repair endonuclease [Phycicoccus sonneratiae]|uniref:Very short patch repair endonuclease n=1 Tax=Phycicoccus sonneratiae TaxID=2807628 RepID=A0ABS2CK63_9MICO|nr:very short patch repair endonuclease [Phycicoccus sonneraticus]MBM6400282.1 DNA mismatch endonuclease Vsr [Phycicoccus sonneraticus]